MSRKVGVVFIGTAKYADFFPEWINCVAANLMPDEQKVAYAFSDRCEEEIFKQPGVVTVEVQHHQWPLITMLRFAFINQVIPSMKNHGITHVLFLDADLFPQTPVSFEDVFGDGSKPLVGVHHPGNFNDPDWNAFVIESDSNANILKMTSETVETIKDKVYHQGCLWGGELSAVQEMVGEMTRAIDEDFQNNIVADWHDESHMNRWFIQNYEKVRTLPSNYAFPDQTYWHQTLSGEKGLHPIMLHVDKKHSDFPRFKGGTPDLDPHIEAHVTAAFAEKGISLPLTCDYCNKVETRSPTQQSLAEWFFSDCGINDEETAEIRRTGIWKLSCEACHEKYFAQTGKATVW